MRHKLINHINVRDTYQDRNWKKNLKGVQRDPLPILMNKLQLSLIYNLQQCNYKITSL